MRFAVEDIDGIDIEQRRRVAARRCLALDRFDRAAEIDAAHGFVLHHLVGAALGDALAEIHGDDAVGERGDTLDAVIDQQHGAARRRASVRIRSEKVLISAAVSPANGSSISTTFGSRATAFATSMRRRSANGSVQGWRCKTPPRPTRSAMARARSVDRSFGRQPQQRIGQQRQLDVFQNGLPLQRTRMLEYDADAGARDPMRRPAGDIDAVELDRAGIGPQDAHDQRHDGRLAGTVRADQADDFAGAQIETHILDGDRRRRSACRGR